MLGKNLIRERDVNFLVEAEATNNYSLSLYKLFGTNGYQKGHDQHYIMASKSLTKEFR